jgi:hypothetical protein
MSIRVATGGRALDIRERDQRHRRHRRRLRAHGAGLLGEVAQYEDSYRLCYLGGPAGIIVALAEQIS